MRRRALEPAARVRAVLKDGAALAAERNAARAGDGMPSDDERAMAWASTEYSMSNFTPLRTGRGDFCADGVLCNQKIDHCE